MRAAFSPAAMLTEEGSINQEFFKPTKVFVDNGVICVSTKHISSSHGFHCRWLWLMTRSGATTSEICYTRCSKCILILYSIYTLEI